MLIDGREHPVLPAAEVARQKSVFLETVYRAITAGKLNGYQAGGTWLVMNDATLDAWTPPAPGRPRKRAKRKSKKQGLKGRDEGFPRDEG